MANSILSSLLSKSTLSLVNDASGANLAKALKVARVSVQYRSRPMRHMKEDGETVVDSRIIDQTYLTIEAFCASLDDLEILNNVLKDRESTYTISSNGLVFKKMVAESVDIKQGSDMLSASPVRIGMKELMQQSGGAKHRVVEQPADSSVYAKGIHQLSAETRPVTDTFNRAIGTALPPLPR